MNGTLFKALMSISSTSTSAKQLADKILVEASPDLIKQLHLQIQQLESKIADLTAIVVEPEEISDEESHQLARSLHIRFKDVDAIALMKFDRSYVSMYPKFVRTIVATVLKNKAIELDVQPLSEWLDVIALGGEIK